MKYIGLLEIRISTLKILSTQDMFCQKPGNYQFTKNTGGVFVTLRFVHFSTVIRVLSREVIMYRKMTFLRCLSNRVHVRQLCKFNSSIQFHTLEFQIKEWQQHIWYPNSSMSACITLKKKCLRFKLANSRFLSFQSSGCIIATEQRKIKILLHCNEYHIK